MNARKARKNTKNYKDSSVITKEQHLTYIYDKLNYLIANSSSQGKTYVVMNLRTDYPDEFSLSKLEYLKEIRLHYKKLGFKVKTQVRKPEWSEKGIAKNYFRCGYTDSTLVPIIHISW
ncbi:hypothetical protein [Staphylococcus phage S25-3]|uniref:Uncharacterized protein n=2 Tax=Kayvirus TaxID=1857843 RepID=V5XXL4_BPS25|nr:hypothetical protein X577_gp003 [Staphylococcus phage S25-4]YP_008854336.1 hypothetical protein X600_gp005 [Staphylococcus phage S25-3]BAO09364.1 hypothetical protein [Staphylococcus phage S25-3]BAO09550.1 hypothetical protein [Staphylococcus phage S25-4]